MAINLGGGIDFTKTDIGLSNVDNSSDTNKPVSTAQQTALDLKLDTTVLTDAASTTTINAAAYTTTGGAQYLTNRIMNTTNTKPYVTYTDGGSTVLHHDGNTILTTGASGVNVVGSISATGAINGVTAVNLVNPGTSASMSARAVNASYKLQAVGNNLTILYLNDSAGINGRTAMLAKREGKVALYYDNAAKFETTDTGALVTGVMKGTVAPTSADHLTRKDYVDTALALKEDISALGTAAYEDITTSSNDATAGRVLTQGSIGFEYQRHIKTTKAFASAGAGTPEVFYLGTIVSGTHNIQFSTRGNSGYNTYEINLEMTFNNTGTDGVSPHAGVTATSEIKGDGADEFLSFSTIKVNGSTAAVYLLYQDPSVTHNLQVGYNSFTADTIGVSPNATETWTTLSAATASSGSNEIPTLLYMDGTSLSYNGDEVLTDGNTNLNEFITNTIGERLLEGTGISTTEVDCPLPTSSFTYPASLTAVGGYTIVDSRTGSVRATNVLPVLSPLSTPKVVYARFTMPVGPVGKRYQIIADTTNSKITVNF